MHNNIFYALAFFYMILIWVGYHKVFSVIYFNTVKALFREFVISLILGYDCQSESEPRADLILSHLTLA